MSFDFSVYKGSPFIWGSVQTTTGLNFVYRGAPLLLVNTPAGATHSFIYTYDTLGRLTGVTIGNLTTIAYNYADNLGNRSSEVTVCGPNGC